MKLRFFFDQYRRLSRKQYTRYACSYCRSQMGNHIYTGSNGVIFDDVEWPWKAGPEETSSGVDLHSLSATCARPGHWKTNVQSDDSLSVNCGQLSRLIRCPSLNQTTDEEKQGSKVSSEYLLPMWVVSQYGWCLLGSLNNKHMLLPSDKQLPNSAW